VCAACAPRMRESQRRHEAIWGGNPSYGPSVRSGTSKCGEWPHAWCLKRCSSRRDNVCVSVSGPSDTACVRTAMKARGEAHKMKTCFIYMHRNKVRAKTITHNHATGQATWRTHTHTHTHTICCFNHSSQNDTALQKWWEIPFAETQYPARCKRRVAKSPCRGPCVGPFLEHAGTVLQHTPIIPALCDLCLGETLYLGRCYGHANTLAELPHTPTHRSRRQNTTCHAHTCRSLMHTTHCNTRRPRDIQTSHHYRHVEPHGKRTAWSHTRSPASQTQCVHTNGRHACTRVHSHKRLPVQKWVALRGTLLERIETRQTDAYLKCPDLKRICRVGVYGGRLVHAGYAHNLRAG